MLKFNEELLQFIWQNRLIKPGPYSTTLGQKLQILKTGELNKDSGPDFFNSQIRINDLLLAGNIEVHIKTSDWLRHQHQDDRSYDHIILHVVYEHDTDLQQNLNNNVEILELKDLVTDETLKMYQYLV